ncbi:hypothetical protein, partial [Rhodoferax sp.]|uniref:hypothetical protein n=1 Tax=Rhodoferax sp. TaxID=50421 RepID=UPI00274E1B4D|nr:hypothetical protein [Rhodoferax sp.]
RETVNELLNRAEKTWTAAGFKVKRNHAAGWGIVSALSGQCLATLQLTDRRGAFGYFSRGKPASVSAGAAAIKDAPLPHGAKITSSVSSDDDGRKGMTLSMTSTQAMQDLLGFFMKHLHANQWQGTRATAYAPAKPGVASMLISAQRDRQQIQIMMWAASETQIVMTLGEAI